MKVKEGDKFTVDTYKIKQYEGERVCSEVVVIETPKPRAKFVLCEVAHLQANCLVPVKELKTL